MHIRFVPVLLCVLASGCAFATEATPLDALRAAHPGGVPWTVDVLDLAGKPLATLHLNFTTQAASSCLGGQKGVRVEFAQRDSAPLSLGSYGVAMFTDGKVKIDLTGGMCDAYLIMEGAFAADGASSGEIYRFGMRGGQNLGTYQATVK